MPPAFEDDAVGDEAAAEDCAELDPDDGLLEDASPAELLLDELDELLACDGCDAVELGALDWAGAGLLLLLAELGELLACGDAVVVELGALDCAG